MQLKNQTSGNKTVFGFFYYFDIERNCGDLKSKSPCILLNKMININFNKNDMESKTENPQTVLEKRTLRFSSYKNLKLKGKTIMSWSSRKRRGNFLYRLFCTKGNFLRFTFYLNYSVLKTLSENTYFCTSKNITSYTSVACF